MKQDKIKKLINAINVTKDEIAEKAIIFDVCMKS